MEQFIEGLKKDPLNNISPQLLESKMYILKFIQCLGVFFYIFISTTLMTAGWFILLPHYYTDPSSLSIARYFAVFIYINLNLNYFLTMCMNSYYRTSFNDGLPMHRNESGHCDKCNQQIPARAHHCIMCKRCILRRDHHCFFTGACIGFHNQRYFIVFCFYAMIGCAWGTWHMKQFLETEFASMFSADWYHFIPPITCVEYIFGYLDTINVFLILHMWMCAASSLGGAWYMLFQMFLVLRGQTTYEFLSGVVCYKGSVSHHLRAVFGNYWFLNFFFPMVWFKVPGDGVSWNVKYV